MISNNLRDITNFLNKQLKLFSDDSLKTKDVVNAYERYLECVSKSSNKRFKNSLNTNHQVLYSVFLYFVSNELFKRNKIDLADAVYSLNKCLHSVDLFYEIDLPTHFLSEHPLGSVLGRATYGDYLFFHQNCTIGASLLKKPKIGNYVVLCANSSIIGDCTIGNYVIVSTGTVIKNSNVKDYSIVFPDGVIKDYSKRKEQLINMIEILTEFKIQQKE